MEFTTASRIGHAEIHEEPFDAPPHPPQPYFDQVPQSELKVFKATDGQRYSTSYEGQTASRVQPAELVSNIQGSITRAPPNSWLTYTMDAKGDAEESKSRLAKRWMPTSHAVHNASPHGAGVEAVHQDVFDIAEASMPYMEGFLPQAETLTTYQEKLVPHPEQAFQQQVLRSRTTASSIEHRLPDVGMPQVVEADSATMPAAPNFVWLRDPNGGRRVMELHDAKHPEPPQRHRDEVKATPGDFSASSYVGKFKTATKQHLVDPSKMLADIQDHAECITFAREADMERASRDLASGKLSVKPSTAVPRVFFKADGICSINNDKVLKVKGRAPEMKKTASSVKFG